jgi:hypothetical protein
LRFNGRGNDQRVKVCADAAAILGKQEDSKALQFFEQRSIRAPVKAAVRPANPIPALPEYLRQGVHAAPPDADEVIFFHWYEL